MVRGWSMGNAVTTTPKNTRGYAFEPKAKVDSEPRWPLETIFPLQTAAPVNARPMIATITPADTRG